MVDYFDGRSFTNLLTVEDAPVDLVYFMGIWGFSVNDVYVVGYGTDRSPSPSGGGGEMMRASYIYHFDGSAWSVHDVTDLPQHSTFPSELHAVWGASPNDVWVVGSRGKILRLRQ